MTEQKSFTGRWSLPGSDRAIPGTLSFVPAEGFHLQLDGSFFFDMHVTHPPVLPAVHGQTARGEAITLFDVTGMQWLQSGYVTAEYRCDFGLIGVHVDSQNDLKLTSVSLSYPNMEECIGGTGLRGGPVDRDDKLFACEAVYESPKVLRFRLADFAVSAVFRGAFNDGARPHFWTISEHASLTIAASTAQRLDRFDEPMDSLRMLFELALDTWVPLTHFGGTMEVDHRGERRNVTIEFLMRQHRVLPLPRHRYFAEVLFWLSGFVDLQSTIDRWHAARRAYGPVVDLFSSLARSAMRAP